MAIAWLSHAVLRGKAFLSEYFLGSRGFGVIAFTLTFGATSASAGSFAGFPALVYAHGWIGGLWIAGYMATPLCAMGLMAKRINQLSRKTGAITLPDVLRERFNSPALAHGATVLVIGLLSVYLVPQFKLASLILKQLLADAPLLRSCAAQVAELQLATGLLAGVDPEYLVCLACFAAVVIVYTTVGGFRAVVWTDVVQGVMMLVGVIALLVLVLRQSGGLTAAAAELAQQTPPRLGEVVFRIESPRDEPVRIATDAWFTLGEGDAVAVCRTNETAVIPAGETESKPVKTVEVASSRARSGPIPEEIPPLPAGVTASVVVPADDSKHDGDGFASYTHGAGERGAYLRGPGPTPSPTVFLSLGAALSFFVYWPISGAGQPGNMVRLMAFNSARTLKRSIALLAVYYTLIYPSIVVIFCCSRTLAPGLDYTPDRIMPVLSFQVSHTAGAPWLAGLLVAAPFAAAMSTVDSFMLMISSALVRDLYQRSINPDASERRLKWLSYASMALVGLAVTAAAANPPRLMQYVIVFAGGAASAGFFMPMLLGLYWPRTTTSGAGAAMLVGIVVYLGSYLIGYLQTGAVTPAIFLALDPLIWAFAASAAAGILVSRWSAPPPREQVERFFGRVG